jgi:pyrimidine deaminase RibD-like protein
MYNEELATAVLARLHKEFPTLVHSKGLYVLLQPQFPKITENEWLKSLDALLQTGLIEGVPLREGSTLADLANISISARGREELRKQDIGSRQTASETDQWGFARLAIEEARKSMPEDRRMHPKVGVAVVKDGRLLASAHRGEFPQCHAEFVALEKKLAHESLLGATVYTTLEPCTSRNHPKVPCAIRLVERKVARVVIGILDPDSRISGRGQRLLRKAGVVTELFPHDLMAEIEEMNRDFIRDRESQEGHQSAKSSAPPKLRVTMKRGHASNFLLTYDNDEDEAVFIRSARLFFGKVELTDPLTPADPEMWKVAPHSSITFGKSIVHQRNPAASLVKMNSNAGIFFEVEIDVIVSCEMSGQLFEVPRTLYVRVDASNNEIVQLV